MTLQEMLQLYAPLAGLLCVVFWLGVLSERVSTLKARVASAEGEIKKIQGDDGAGIGRIIRLEITVENLAVQVQSIVRSMEGVQRQFANMIQRGPPMEFAAHD